MNVLSWLWSQLSPPSPGSWLDRIPPDFQVGIKLLAFFLLLLWALELIDTMLGGRLDNLGIRPRQLAGLPGIGLAPLLHGNLQHLAANTGPLAILGSLILLQGLPVLLMVTGLTWFSSGVGTWLLGRPHTNHLGASGIVFGYLGYLLFYGYFERSGAAIAVAVLAGFLYGSALWGLLPMTRGRSWVGHTMGFLGGLLAARHMDVLREWWQMNMGV